MPFPRAVLLCPPQFFDVIDVKNPFMEGQQGKVDRALAGRQWSELMSAFDRIGIEIHTVAPVAGCEDMVFCANPVFTGLDAEGGRVCVPSHMRFASRQQEVAPEVVWCRAHGYRVVELTSPGMFEGGGDAIWHPGRRLIWAGQGPRSEKAAGDEIARIFDVPVLHLELRSERFYHLDTCFCPVDENTVLVHAPALAAGGMDLVRSVFERVIEVDGYEATRLMACNAAAFLGKYVVIQAGAAKVNWALRDLGFEAIEVETSEFMKSGGSVYCMKSYLF